MKKIDLGKKLQHIRKLKNLTQAGLAEKAGVNEKHISKLETGIYFPTYTTLNKILQALDLNIEDVGLDFVQIKSIDNPLYIKSLQILNSAADEKEQEYYYGILTQAKKGVKLFKT